jgi:hypothetical protein
VKSDEPIEFVANTRNKYVSAGVRFVYVYVKDVKAWAVDQELPPFVEYCTE